MLDRSINLPGCVPPGKSTLDLVAEREHAKELLELDDAEAKRQMLRDARRNPLFGSVLPGNNERLFARVCRWKTAVCKGPPGMLRAVASGISAVEESIALFSSLPA